MVRITFVCVGKLKEAYWRDAVREYEKRLSRFCKAEIKELPERANLKEEAEDILRACRGYVIALAVEGKQCSSEAFVIGSSCGLYGSVKSAAKELLSFSQLTFPHQMMRAVLLEQVYRAFMIIGGAEYHK